MINTCLQFATELNRIVWLLMYFNF
jgi:hypothetical protein